MTKKKKVITAGLIVVLLFAVFGVLNFLPVFDALEYKAYDFRVNFFADSYKTSEEITLILLTQDCIDWAAGERGWGWPWPRSAYADIVDYMNMGGAKSIAFDVFFTEPSMYQKLSDQYADDDAFAQAGKNYGRVVQTVYPNRQAGSHETWPEDLHKPLFNLNGFDSIISHYYEPVALFPIPDLRNAAGAMGSVNNAPDPDEVNRRAKLFTDFDGKAVPGLSAASLLASGTGRDIFYNAKKRQIEWDGYEIPVDSEGNSILRFKGDISRYGNCIASDILKSMEAAAKGEEPDYYPEDFEGSYVFFGFFAPGLFDICTNPQGTNYPGIGMHITMLDNMLSGDFIREAPVWLDMAALFVIILLTTILALFCNRLHFSVGGAALMAALIVAGAFIAYDKLCLWVPMVLPLAGLFVTFLSCTVYNYATEGSQKRFIKSAFSRYISPVYVDQLIANPGQLKLGGERVEISIFFSDVQGFTTISENLDPEQLKELLNEYLTFLTNIIKDSGGTIDKYEGDAIIAFWNAPLHMEDHASRALGAAIECQARLAEKKEHFEGMFRSWNIHTPEINKHMVTRIGLNTGYAVVGNFGSQGHFNYTMLGDSVNLAARLEGLNKQFGTSLMCTEHTMNEANNYGRFYGRRLAQVAVVGKNEPVAVWEPMPEAVFREKESIIQQFDEARNMFYSGDFSRSLALFEALKDKDSPSVYYAKQCRYYLEKPSEWQGFWKAASK